MGRSPLCISLHFSLQDLFLGLQSLLLFYSFAYPELNLTLVFLAEGASALPSAFLFRFGDDTSSSLQAGSCINDQYLERFKVHEAVIPLIF